MKKKQTAGSTGQGKPFRAEFSFSISGHERRRKAKCAQTQTALRTAAHIVYNSDCSLIKLFLIMILILHHIQVDKVAQIRAGIPANVVGVDIDLTELFDHFHLIGTVGLGSWGGSSQIRRGVLVIMVAIGGRNFDGGERERVRDLQVGLNVHPDEKTGRGGRKRLSAVFNYFHNHLAVAQSCNIIFSTATGASIQVLRLGPL